ncbi:hypothetical protein CHS0354_029555, partial [Potamilus streckersoni]
MAGVLFIFLYWLGRGVWSLFNILDPFVDYVFQYAQGHSAIAKNDVMEFGQIE